MLGRGVKRKRSCSEEEPEAGPQPDMSRLLQRQRLLGLCMEKLQGHQAGAEPSLRRSVLLANTLRQIQEDMQSDGGAAACPACSGPPPECCSQEPEQQRSAPAAAVSDAASAMGYLGDLALDMDIFEDIDTSMFETTELPSCWAAVAAAATGSPWPLGVSLWADEDAKTGPPASLHSRLMDLNELDHIMEILVKS
ncbi:SERTA domain-containing protein 2 [Pungitius pungitius]|uniref:SERTA domain-containing protein 2 n=1 Tax=Pungitius pungitius TaxID=134920 RepID=UPI002E0F047A